MGNLDWWLEHALAILLDQEIATQNDLLQSAEYIIFAGKIAGHGEYIISSMDEVKKDITVEELIQLSTRYNQILYKFDLPPDKKSHQRIEGKVNAFKLMMDTSNENIDTPNKISNPKNGRDNLRNYVIEYIISSKNSRFLKT